MIPREAFVALTILTVTAWLFGIVCDRLLTGWLQNHADQHDQDPPRHGCDTCKFSGVDPREEPCLTCVTDDMDMWEEKT